MYKYCNIEVFYIEYIKLYQEIDNYTSDNLFKKFEKL